MAEDIPSKRQEIIDASVAAFKSLIINKYNNQTFSDITVASKKWWSTGGNASSLTWACCKEDTTSDTGTLLEQTTYNINRNTYWRTAAGGIFPSVGYGNPVYYNSARYILYAGELTRSSRLDDNGNIVIEYDAVWDMGVSRLLSDGTYDMREGDPNTEQQTGGWKVPIPNLVYDSWIRPDANCWDGACNSIEDTKKDCGVLCSSLIPVAKTEPVYCTPAFEESYTIGNFTISQVIVPDDPDVPSDYEEIEYLSLQPGQVVLLDTMCGSVHWPTSVTCEFDMEQDTTITYSPDTSYNILSVPLYYSPSTSGDCDLNYYSDPQSMEVRIGYSNSNLAACKYDMPYIHTCGTPSTDTVSLEKSFNGSHVVKAELRVDTENSVLHLDDYDYVPTYLDGHFQAPLSSCQVLAVGGGDDNRYSQLTAVRKIRSVRIGSEASSDSIILQPVRYSGNREGLLNKSTGKIVGPITAKQTSNHYDLDYIVVPGSSGIKTRLYAGPSISPGIHFNIPNESGLGVVTLLTLQGNIYSNPTSVAFAVDTYSNSDGTVTRHIISLLKNYEYPNYSPISVHNIPVDDNWHYYSLSCESGDIMLDGSVIDNVGEYALDWDTPSDSSEPIFVGRSSPGDGYGDLLFGVKRVWVNNAFEESNSTGSMVNTPWRLYVPAMNSNYVACLSGTTAYLEEGEYPTMLTDPIYNEYSICGFAIQDAGVRLLPGRCSI